MIALAWAAGTLYLIVYMVVAIAVCMRLNEREPDRLNIVAGPAIALFWPLWLPVWPLVRAFRRPRGRHAAGRSRPAPEPATDVEVTSC